MIVLVRRVGKKLAKHFKANALSQTDSALELLTDMRYNI